MGGKIHAKSLRRFALENNFAIQRKTFRIGYFDIQLYIDDLIKDEFLSALDYDGKSVLTLSAMGKETLNVFQQKIPAYITDMIDLYLKENREKIFKIGRAHV